jgi:hypothetical protein
MMEFTFMKSGILVVLASLLLLAAPAFAEVNMHGEFAYGFNTNADVYEGVFDTGDLYFTGTSLNGNASVVFGMDFTHISLGMDGISTNDFLPVDFISDVYMTFDLTGAIGGDSPVAVEMLMGRSSYGAGNYLGDITGYSTYDIINAETGTFGGFGITFNILDTINIEYALDPNLVDGVQNMYANVNGTFAVVSAEIYGTLVGDSYTAGDAYSSIGTDFVASLDTVSFGAGAEYSFESEAVLYGVSVRTPIIPRTDMGVAFMGYSDSDVNPYGLGFDANYAITDAFKVYGALLLKDLESLDADNSIGYEVSASYTFIGDATVYVGYAAAGSGFNALGDLTEDSFFMAASASF